MALSNNRQLCVVLQDAKKLEPQTEIETVCAGDSNLLSYAWLLKKRGNADNSISMKVDTLMTIQKKGVVLSNPDSFETMLATEPLTQARKYAFVSVYTNYTRVMKIQWEPIRVRYNPKEQWIPTKDEINAMVNGASKRFAPILQTLLTTGARIGELCKLKWTDINSENCTISINDAEKGSRNRTLKVPSKTILMINGLPKTNDVYVFDTKPSNVRVRLQDLRKKLARTQNNPRFLRIHLHTFRTYFGTQKARHAKTPYQVRDALGHKNLNTTDRYIRLANFQEDTYETVKATTEEEILRLGEEGYEQYSELNEVKFFRRLKD